MEKLKQRGTSEALWTRPQDMPELIYLLLARRGVGSAEEAARFLNPSKEQLHNPFLLGGMEEAATRLHKALEKGERLCIYGDYDVDGVSATAILTLFLRQRGYECFNYIPERHTEGYGLNKKAVRGIAAECELLITVDCGISCQEEIALAATLGLDVIVTDHHRPGAVLPDCIVINPLLNDYPFPSLCGAGVAFKLACALGGLDAAMEFIDLAALATVADLVPLTGENRVIVSLGLKRLNQSPRLGIEKLIESASLTGRALSAGSIGFQLAPRINASGRLGDAKRALTLLTTADPAEAESIAAELEEENTRRRQEEKRIVEAAEDMMRSYSLLDHKIIVLAGKGWNAGVIGLAASKLVSEYHYPVILLSEAEDGVCVGSCRSIPAVDIFAAISSGANLLMRFGGHRQAAGLTMARAHVDEFIARLDDYLAANTSPDDYIPELEYDLNCALDQISMEAVRQMEKLQPTGFGNPSAVLLTRAMIDSARAVGKDGAHLQLRLSQGDSLVPGIAFGMGAMAAELAGTTRDMLFAPGINEYNGHVSVQCDVKNFISEPMKQIFDRFDEKYPRHERTYLTEVLYNIELNYSMIKPEPVDAEQLGDWLKKSPQGTLIAAATLEGARALLAFLAERGLTERADTLIGRWPDGKTAMNAVCLCPRGACPVAYRRVIVWDAPAEAFAALPAGEKYAAGMRQSASWMAELPGVDTLRRVYIAARSWGAQGIARVSLEDIEREAARLTGLPPGTTVQASLAVLGAMELIHIDPEAAKLSLMPNKKSNPDDNPLYRRLRLIYEYAMKKE